jgi:hypothetical protein
VNDEEEPTVDQNNNNNVQLQEKVPLIGEMTSHLSLNAGNQETIELSDEEMMDQRESGDGKSAPTSAPEQNQLTKDAQALPRDYAQVRKKLIPPPLVLPAVAQAYKDAQVPVNAKTTSSAPNSSSKNVPSKVILKLTRQSHEALLPVLFTTPASVVLDDIALDPEMQKYQNQSDQVHNSRALHDSNRKTPETDELIHGVPAQSIFPREMPSTPTAIYNKEMSSAQENVLQYQPLSANEIAQRILQNLNRRSPNENEHQDQSSVPPKNTQVSDQQRDVQVPMETNEDESVQETANLLMETEMSTKKVNKSTGHDNVPTDTEGITRNTLGVLSGTASSEEELLERHRAALIRERIMNAARVPMANATATAQVDHDALNQMEVLPINSDAQSSAKTAEHETDEHETDELENAEYEPQSVLVAGPTHVITTLSHDEVSAAYPIYDSPDFTTLTAVGSTTTTAVGSPINPPNDLSGRSRVEEK